MTIPPFEKGMAEQSLPEMLDTARILAHDEGREILDRPDDGARLELERRLAETVEPWNVGLHPDEYPIAQPRVDDDAVDRGDLHRTLRITVR